MNREKVRMNRFSDDYSISIDISQGVLLTPMSSGATALFDFFRQFSDEEPNFPRKDVDRPSDSLFKMSGAPILSMNLYCLYA